MTSLRMLPAMDIHQTNDEHDVRYRFSKNRYPTDESNDQFELFICPYMKDHHITSKRWRIHLQKCKENYGGNTKPCVFNASHHVPVPEYEWHTMTCPDRNILRSEYEKREWKLASEVNHNPDWKEPETGETWDDQLDEDVEEFTLDVKKGMPLALKPKEYKEEEESYYGAVEGDENEAETYDEQEYVASVTDEELIPERPSNWNEMSKTQKKNHKRKYDRQRQRMAEEGVTEEDFQPVKDPTLWTEKKREDKLKYIKSQYPMADDKANATRFDYTSLLNIVCQKVRINLPEYQPCSSIHGGFAYRCRVHQTWYEGKEFAATKKDAKHECAKWALLGMEIPGVDTAAPDKKPMPIHPKLLNKAAQMREGDEVGRLMGAGMYQPKKGPVLRQPRLDMGAKSPQRNSPRVASPHENPEEDSLSSFVQQLAEVEKQQQAQPSGNSIEDFLRMREGEEKSMPATQELQTAPRGWGQPPVQTQQNQQIRQPQYQPQQPRQVRPQQPPAQSRPTQPQKAWGGWGAPNAASGRSSNQPIVGGASGMNHIQNSMNSMSLDSGTDFPSLGSDEWQTVPKKSGGVNGARGRGRGRGRGTTTMKL